MDSIVQIIKVLGPILLTSGLTFLITRYSLLRNKTRMIEKSYDRFYYPCYFKLKELELDKKYQETLEYIKNRSLKWNKYVDKTTLKCIENFEKNINNKYCKKYYNYLYDDICKHNRKYRLRLGYPESFFYNGFKYLSFRLKMLFISCCFIFAMYFTVIVLDLISKLNFSLYNEIKEYAINSISFYIIGLFVIIFIWLVYFIWIGLTKIVQFLIKKNKKS